MSLGQQSSRRWLGGGGRASTIDWDYLFGSIKDETGHRLNKNQVQNIHDSLKKKMK